MEQPISAILIVNTVANTAGAAVAGAQAHVLFGDGALIWFSVVFTLCVLFLSEIMPKIVGVAYSRPISRTMAVPWAAGIAMLFPVIWSIERLARVVKPANSLSAPEEEVNQLAMISAEEGSIMPYEADLVRNSPWSASFAEIWQIRLRVAVGDYELNKSLLLCINDGLMTIFFFVVGLEIKRELVAG